jgi:hypothetical protein
VKIIVLSELLGEHWNLVRLYTKSCVPTMAIAGTGELQHEAKGFTQPLGTSRHIFYLRSSEYDSV